MIHPKIKTRKKKIKLSRQSSKKSKKNVGGDGDGEDSSFTDFINSKIKTNRNNNSSKKNMFKHNKIQKKVAMRARQKIKTI